MQEGVRNALDAPISDSSQAQHVSLKVLFPESNPSLIAEVTFAVSFP